MLKLIISFALLAVAFGDVSHLFHHQGGAGESAARILKFESDINPDGTYRYAYETENGIHAQEQGQGGVSAQGDFGWASPEGQHVRISYVADENGYQPVGDAIPQPPPIPEQIQKALAWIAAHPPPPERF